MACFSVFLARASAVGLYLTAALSGAALSGAALSGAAQADAPRVVVSIKPIHSLVASVMKGVGKPYLLVKGGASPHSYALRPSEARRLSKANIIFWVGESLETFLAKPVASLGKRARVVELHDAKGIQLLKSREGGLWERHDDHDDHDHKKGGHKKDDHKKEAGHKHGHDKKAAGHADHDHGDHDMHIWLDPNNAKAIVRAAAEALISVDPASAAAYRRNAAQTLKRLEALDTELKTLLGPVRARRYLVFHDAYQYFEKRYGLSAAGSVTINPQRRPGAKRISTLRGRIKRDKVRCVFIEPQFPPKIVKTVVAGTGARTATLDPIGARIPKGEDAYFVLLRGLATSLKGCLS